MDSEQSVVNRSSGPGPDQQHTKAQHFYVAVSTQDSKLVGYLCGTRVAVS